MPDEFSIDTRAARLQELNSLDEITARRAAIKLGDMIALDEQGRGVVVIDGQELHLVLPRPLP